MKDGGWQSEVTVIKTSPLTIFRNRIYIATIFVPIPLTHTEKEINKYIIILIWNKLQTVGLNIYHRGSYFRFKISYWL
jgi:hypothetical protein